jgi:succinyl-diaminopimelate desuccinylase|tara:strand:- start:3193 stop:4353 length:1161 start_codon:yes stop_codon:yes gene_type:complete
MIDKNKAQNIFQEFLRIESITPNAKKAFDFLEDLFKKNNFEIHRVKFKLDDSYEVENMFAIKGKGSPHLCFSGHVDVVTPGDHNNWRHPPFSGKIEDNRVYSRGAEDMKGSIISSLVAGINYFEENMTSNGSLSYLITGDEEGLAINGTEPLIDWVFKQGFQIDHCIVTEPSNKEMIGDTIKIGRRGSLSFELDIIGKQGHVAYPEKAKNPIPFALKAIQDLSGKIDEGTKDFISTNIEVTSIDVNNNAHNVIPEKMSVSFNIRFNNLWNEKSLIKFVNDILSRNFKEVKIDWKLNKISKADVYITSSGDLSNILKESIYKKTQLEAELSSFGGTSDARFISKYCPVIEFGLVGRTMHQIDENVPLDEFYLLTDIFEDFLVNYYSG